MQAVSTDKAPKAIGPYSQAITAPITPQGLVFASGQIALSPETGTLISGSVSDQTRRVLDNLQAVLESAGSSLNKVVKTTVYLADMGDFEEVNKVYGEYFQSTKPARATVQVARLPRDARVEIDAIALA